MTVRRNQAFAALQDAARRSGDQRLLSVASLIRGPSVKTKFDPIIKAIEKMVKQLQDEEKVDLETKQTCEKDRMADTRDAIVASRDIDEMTDSITKLTEEIAQCKKTIEVLVAEHKKAKDALAKAQRMRDDENKAWKVTDADDKAAAETVKSARDVLEGFYKDNNLGLVQKSKQPVSGMAAGDAPPPPPPTWEGGYGGKTGESQGIVAIMEMVHDDIVKDRADAKADEDSSQKEFDAFKKDSEKQMKDLLAEKNKQEKVKGSKETKHSDTKKARA